MFKNVILEAALATYSRAAAQPGYAKIEAPRGAIRDGSGPLLA